MKYLIINGSPRKKNTWAIVKRIKDNLKGDFEEVNLSKSDIHCVSISSSNSYSHIE